MGEGEEGASLEERSRALVGEVGVAHQGEGLKPVQRRRKEDANNFVMISSIIGHFMNSNGFKKVLYKDSTGSVPSLKQVDTDHTRCTDSTMGVAQPPYTS